MACLGRRCLDPLRPTGNVHFRAARMDIWEARDEFTRLDADDEWPTCKGLRLLP